MLTPPDMNLWQGRNDANEGDPGLRWHQIIKPAAAAAEPGTVLLGFACDAGVARNQGRPGAAAGPDQIRRMLANMPVNNCGNLYDAGDVRCLDENLEEVQQKLGKEAAALLAAGHFPLVLGGGHEVAYGSFSGLTRQLWSAADKPSIGIINFDAHFDLRLEPFASSGTPFRQIAMDCKAAEAPFRYCCLGISEYANTQALFTRARQLGVEWLLDEELTGDRLQQALESVTRFADSVEHLYLTICLDVLPAAVAPGVSAPAARGVGLDMIEPLIDRICATGKLRLADMAELNPDKDIDQRTARVAARLAARIIEKRAASDTKG